MAILIGGVLALVLLYFWLLGHWFARVVMLIIFAALMAYSGAVLMVAGSGQPNPGGAVFGAVLGAVLAWPVSGLPIYYWRSKVRQASLELALR